MQYGASEGIPALREAVAARRRVDPEAVLITNGAAEANYLAMAASLEATGGESFLTTDPVYPYYPARARLLGARTTPVEVGPEGDLDPHAVRERATSDTAAIVVNTPNNPTGAVYDAATMAELAEIAEDVGAYLISDEVYHHFDYSGRFRSASTLASERVFTTQAMSKSMAITGFRVGYLIAPEAIRSAVRRYHLLINVTSSRPAQTAVLHALENTEPSYYRDRRRIMQTRIETFVEAVHDVGGEVVVPDGGFYVMARFPGHSGTLATVERLIEACGIVAMPGNPFGTSTNEWLRFSLLTHRVDEAVTRLRAYFG